MLHRFLAGVFGSHLSNVMRRLRRIAQFHGSDPVFILASATIGNPEEHAARIVGEPVTLLGESGAPAGPRRLMVYNPPVVNPELGIRQSYLKATVRIAGDLVEGATLRMTYRRPWPPIPLVVSCRVHHAVHGRSLRWSAPHGLAARLLHADHGWSLAPGPTPGTTTFTRMRVSSPWRSPISETS